MKGLITTLFATAMVVSAPLKADANPAIVDFRRCIEESKFGKQEQNSLEALKKQLAESIEGTEEQLQDIARKAQDPDYIDSLSPEAEEQLRMRYGGLSRELSEKQQQFYQMISQAEYKLLQEMNLQVMRSAQMVAKEEGFDMVLRNDAALYFQNSMDITDSVIKELDAIFDQEMKS